MPTKSASKTITRNPDWLGPAIPPGEILLEAYLKPLGLGQLDAAKRFGISLNRLNEQTERVASRRTTMASSSSGALGLFASLCRQQLLRRRNFGPPNARTRSRRRPRRQLHSPEAASTDRLRRAAQFARRSPKARTADQALEHAEEGATAPR